MIYRKIFILLFGFLPIIYSCAVEFNFVVIGDTRPPFGTDSYTNFEKQIQLINAAKPDLMINVGDLIFGYGSKDVEY